MGLSPLSAERRCGAVGDQKSPRSGLQKSAGQAQPDCMKGASLRARPSIFHTMFLVSLSFEIHWVVPPYEMRCQSRDVFKIRSGFVARNRQVGVY
jgi:hypothetical protein